MRILHNMFIRFTIGVVLLGLSSPTHAQWTPTNGPGGHGITALATLGGTWFAGTALGIYRSTDAGANWTLASTAMTTAVNALATNGATLFAATDSGVYRSENAGAGWKLLTNGLSRDAAHAIAVHGSACFAATPRLHRSLDNGDSWDSLNTRADVLAAASGFVIAAINGGAWNSASDTGGVFRSTDNGNSWKQLRGGLPTDQQFFIYDPATGRTDSYYNYYFLRAMTTSGDTVLAGTLHGIYRSVDRGDTWSRVDPDDSAGTAFTIDGDYVAGTDAGFVHRSTDAGAHWTTIGRISNVSVTALGAFSGQLLAGTNDDLFASTDRGAQWAASSRGVASNAVVNAFATLGDSLFAATDKSIYRSPDGGATWHKINDTMPGATALMFHDGFLFAGTSGNGVMRSSDDGANWLAVDSGLTDRSGNGSMFTVALAENGGTIFMGTLGAAVFASSNDGDRWSGASDGITAGYVQSLDAFDGRVFAWTNFGADVSTDNGAHWNMIEGGLAQQEVKSIIHVGDTLYAAVTNAHVGGVYRSTNGGHDWTSAGLTASWVTGIMARGSTLFAGTTDGANISTDGGAHWTNISDGLPGYPTPASVNTFATIGDTLFAGMGANDFGGSDGVYRSTDNGAHWAPSDSVVGGGGIDPHVTSLIVEGTELVVSTKYGGVYRSLDSGRLWQESDSGLPRASVNGLTALGPNLFAATDRGVFRSRDGGVTWAPSGAALPDSTVLSLAAFGGTLFAGTGHAGAFRSSDKGASWVAIGAGLTDTAIHGFSITDSDFFAFAPLGVYHSSNDGDRWAPLNTGFPPGTTGHVFAAAGANILAGTDGRGVFVSHDGGADWLPTNAGIPDSTSVRAFVSQGGVIFAGSDRGVFTSNDRGANWISANDGFPAGVRIATIAIRADTLIAGTTGLGVWRRPLSQLMSAVHSTRATIDHVTPVLFQNYPNPFTHTTSIRFALSQAERVTLEILDPLGRRITQLADERVAAGTHFVAFDAADLPSGLYRCQLSAGGRTFTTTMAVVR